MTTKTVRTPKTRAATRAATTTPNVRSSLRDPSPQPTIGAPSSTQVASAGAQLPDGHSKGDTQGDAAVGTTLASGHGIPDIQTRPAAGTPSPQSDRDGHTRIDTQTVAAVPDDWGYVHLTFMARVLDDIEGQRKTTDNRLRIMQATDADSDGIVRGFALDADHPAVAALAAYAQSLKDSEKKVTRELERSMKAHPLGPWVMAQKGVGLKQAARLLASVGDPYWNTLHDRPRTVSELWAYCGYKPGQRRQKGQRANWSNDAKMRAWNAVQSIIKAGGPWRELWDERRQWVDGRVHTAPCPPCHAQAGDPYKPGHAKADADRYVAKRLLREMWRESKRLHELAESQQSSDAHAGTALGTPSPIGQSRRDAQCGTADGTTSPDGQRSADTHCPAAVGTNLEGPAA